jgi:hypothetical protein
VVLLDFLSPYISQVSTQAKISSFKSPHIKIDLYPRGQNRGIPDKLWISPPIQFSAIEFLKLLASEFRSLIGSSKTGNRIANKLEINCQRIPQFNWNIKVKNHIANKFRRKIVTFINCHPNLAIVPETCFTTIPEDSISSGIPHCHITHLTMEN